MYIPFYRVRESAKLPARANPSDAGMDVYFCPPSDPIKHSGVVDVEVDADMKILSLNIHSGANVLLPTGLKAGIPHGYALLVCNRSGMAAKKSLVYGAHVIDSGYAGEIFIDLHNIGSAPQRVEIMDKIAQLILVPVVSAQPLEAENEESLYGDYPKTISNRGDGALGSTGK